MNFVLIGDLMVDIVTILQDADIHYGDDNRARVEIHGGGAAANVTAWMAVAGHHPTLHCVVGDDVIGHGLVAELESNGATVRATYSDQPTSAVVALVHPNGERTMFPSASANFGLPANALDAALLPGDHLHVSGYLLLRAHTRDAGMQYIRTAKALGATVSLDPASARLIQLMGADAALAAMRDVDLLIGNELEAIALTNAPDARTAVEMLGRRFPTAIVKLGPDGCATWVDGEYLHQPALPTEVIDTVGAGDAFAAGAIVAWKQGSTVPEILAAGNSFGRSAVQQRGARPPRH